MSKLFNDLLSGLKEIADYYDCNKAKEMINYTKQNGVTASLEKYSLNESMLNEIYPNKGETKGEFISRFMSDKNMKKEYPDNKQRLAVAYSYWDRKDEKMELNEDLFEETNEAKPLSSIFDTEDKPLVVLVDDVNNYTGNQIIEELVKSDDLNESVLKRIPNRRYIGKCDVTDMPTISKDEIYDGDDDYITPYKKEIEKKLKEMGLPI